MAALKVGRNDPCPCGSGNKYKHCHMRLDQAGQQTTPGRVPIDAGINGPVAGGPGGSYDLGQESRRLREELAEVAAYTRAQAEIENAGMVLEAHRAEFNALLKDEAAAVRRTERLFGEERFRPWRFTAADLGRAFAAVGYPQRSGLEADENSEVMNAAMLYLAKQGDYRATMSRRLMSLLPEFVAQGRYLDAWLIQYAAFLMLQRPRQGNPFLGMMFQYGLEDWARQMQEEGEMALRQIGLDPGALRSMDPEQVLAYFQTQMADPARKAEIERFYAEHPLLSQQGQAEIEEMDRRAPSLWRRPDSGSIQLAPSEVEPWLPVLVQHLEPVMEALQRSKKDKPRVTSKLKERASRALADVAAEMAGAIFTRERITQLARDLAAYRLALVEKGEDEAASYAGGAALLLEQEDTRPDDRLLVGICWVTLRSALQPASRAGSE